MISRNCIFFLCGNHVTPSSAALCHHISEVGKILRIGMKVPNPRMCTSEKRYRIVKRMFTSEKSYRIVIRMFIPKKSYRIVIRNEWVCVTRLAEFR